ncbi:MAG: hypothetical protein H7263_10865 [Candidatus Sericytochromatia bacterium]|nr:hypothetical protein [Candidatus Sericytochromatia bacterium]
MNKKNLHITALLLMSFSLIGCDLLSNTNPNPSVVNTSNSIKVNYKVSKTITVGKTPHGMAQAGGFIYNSNIGENTISVIDSKTDTVVKTITLVDGVSGYMRVFKDGKNVLVNDTKKGDLLVIDPLQDHKILQTIHVGSGPDKIRILDDDKTVLVSLTDEEKIIELTFEADRNKTPTKKELKVGKMPEGTEHRFLAVSNEWVAVPNIDDNDVSLVNLSTGVEKRLKDGNEPTVMDINVMNNKAENVVVGNTASNTITIFDINSDSKKTLTDVGLAPTDVVSYPRMNKTFITMSGSNDVAVIDYSTKTLLKRISIGKRPVHIYITNNDKLNNPEIWVGNDDGDSVTVIDPEKMEVKTTISVGNGHHKMAFTNDKAYVSNINDNTITVINRN